VSCAHVASCPELIWNKVVPAGIAPGDTATAVSCLAVVVPLPSWPLPPAPQQ
jgi:hypothetical protein